MDILKKNETEPLRNRAFREALFNLIGPPTRKDLVDTIATDIVHVMEDLESLQQSAEHLQNDLLELWKGDPQKEIDESA